jgi:hypothetical protein
MGFPSADMGYKPYPAIIMLEFMAVQSLLPGPVFHIIFFHSRVWQFSKKKPLPVSPENGFLEFF